MVRRSLWGHHTGDGSVIAVGGGREGKTPPLDLPPKPLGGLKDPLGPPPIGGTSGGLLQELPEGPGGALERALAGFLFGLSMGLKEALDRWFSSLFSLLYPIPSLGWLPLLMLWVGIGELLPIALILICSFFPVLYNTLTGVRGVPRDLVRAAKVLGASNWRTLRDIILPQALPTILTGLRLEAGWPGGW